MGNDVYFNQTCPVCGRTLRILVRLLGCRVYCQHCGGGFMAMDPAMGSGCGRARHAGRSADIVDRLLDRADATLQGMTSGAESD
jgi:hypothetical protein